jgi:hypothetical protein
LRCAPLQIFVECDRHDAVVALHGWLTEPEVGDLAEAVARNGLGVRIDLSHLVGADQAGLVALRRLRDEEGVPLTGSSPLFEMLLGEMQASHVSGESRGPASDRPSD